MRQVELRVGVVLVASVGLLMLMKLCKVCAKKEGRDDGRAVVRAGRQNPIMCLVCPSPHTKQVGALTRCRSRGLLAHAHTPPLTCTGKGPGG